MRLPIEFDHQSVLMTIEIHYIFSKCDLAAELQTTKPSIPENAPEDVFRRRGLCAELPGQLG